MKYSILKHVHYEYIRYFIIELLLFFGQNKHIPNDFRKHYYNSD